MMVRPFSVLKLAGRVHFYCMRRALSDGQYRPKVGLVATYM